MPDNETDRKDEGATGAELEGREAVDAGDGDGPEIVGMDRARAELSPLVERVRWKGERFVLSTFGKPAAALVSLDDLKRLMAMDAAVDAAAPA